MSKKTDKRSKSKKPTTEKNSEASAHLKSVNDRDDLRVPIQLLVDYRANGNYLFDFCRDLGAGGVFIETTKPLSKGSNIDLTFTIPDSKETLRTSGEVIWVQQQVPGRTDLTPGMGVQFSGFQDQQRRTLQEFVKRYHGNRFDGTNSVNTKKPA